MPRSSQRLVVIPAVVAVLVLGAPRSQAGVGAWRQSQSASRAEAGPTQLRSSTADCKATWRVMRTPRIGKGEIAGVSAGSPRDAWAVGEAVRSRVRPLIEHWDGSTWKVVESPRINQGQLNDVTVVSKQNAWAVGSVGKNGPLVEHWDGRRWSRVLVPGLGAALYGVSASSGRDVWAAGGEIYSGGGVVAHWDGMGWEVVYQDRGVYLSDVVALSPSDVWAVGAGASLVMLHWDGRGWPEYTKSTDTNALDVDDPPISYLTSVTATAARDVWAAGDGPNSQTDTPLLYRWNGQRWASARPGGGEAGGLHAIAARSRTDVWSVGWFEDDESGPELDDAIGGGAGGTLWHWNGRSWSATTRPHQWLQAVATDGGRGYWAAGFAGARRGGEVPGSQFATPLIERYGC